METRKEPYRPAPNGLKSQTVNLRTSQDENEILRLAAEKLSQQTGQKENISKTIIEAVKQFKDAEPYFVNEVLFKSICELHSEALPLFQRITAGHATLEIGELKANVLKQIFNRNFADIEKSVNADIDENVKNSHLTNKIFISNLRKDAEEPFGMFLPRTRIALQEIAALSSKYTGIEIDIDTYSIKDGVVSFTDNDKARIKEKYCTIYIDSDSKRNFLKLAEETLLKLQALKAILLKNGINNLFGHENLFSEIDTEGIILNKSIMKFITK
ncbi:MAG: hypothetical protein WCS03_08075 [Bacteroidota bacterium]